ncbi:hypothetical protein AB7W42_19765, partial [Providencia rettgeri]
GADVTLPATSETNAQGEATITLTSTTTAVAGITVSAKVGETETAVDANKTVSFTHGEVAIITLKELNGNTMGVVGEAYSLKVIVQDEYENVIPNQLVKLAISQSNGSFTSITPENATTDSNGEINNISIFDRNTGISKFTATITGSDVIGEFEFEFTPGVVSANSSTIQASPDSIYVEGEGVSDSTITYVAKDLYGNIVDNLIPENMSSSVVGLNDGEYKISDWKYNAEKKAYEATFAAGTKSADVKILPVIDGQVGISSNSDNILTILAGSLDTNMSSIEASVSDLIANGLSTTEVYFYPQDSYGNIISNIDPNTISQSLMSIGDDYVDDLKFGEWTYDSNQNRYEVDVTSGMKTGYAYIMPTINSGNAISGSSDRIKILTLSYTSTVGSIEVESTGDAIANNKDIKTVTIKVYDTDGNLKPNADVSIVTDTSDLLLNNSSSESLQTNSSGELVVEMKSSLYGENRFSVISDRFIEKSSVVFGLYLDPKTSVVEMSKAYIVNDGNDQTVATFYPKDVKGRIVNGLDVTFTTTDTVGTMSQKGYKATFKSTNNPSVYLVDLKVNGYDEYSLPNTVQYSIVPQNGVLLAKISIQTKLCASTAFNASTGMTFKEHCSVDTTLDDDEYNGYRHSGIGFVLNVESASDAWVDRNITLQSQKVSGKLMLESKAKDSDGKSLYSFNCSQDISSKGSWMNDFGDKITNTLTIPFSETRTSYDTVEELDFPKRGVGSCEMDRVIAPAIENNKVVNKQQWPLAKPVLTGEGSVFFKVAAPAYKNSDMEFSVPITGQRIDAGLIGPKLELFIYSGDTE